MNDIQQPGFKLGKTNAQNIVISLSVLAPHLASEILEQIFNVRLRDCQWPSYNPALAQQMTVEIAIQVNGKVRAHLNVARDSGQGVVQPQAEALIEKWLTGKQVRKVIFVPNRLLSFVVAD